MDRLLRVLRRLGEPADVISERMSPAMIQMGRKKGLPFYIVSGALIAFIGLPLGLGAAGILIGVLATIFAVLVAYFSVALSFLVSGVVGMIVSVVVLADPAIPERINEAFGGREVIHLGFGSLLNLPPQTDAALTFVVCAILAGIGALMIWGGRYLLRGTGYLLKVSWQKLREAFGKGRRGDKAARSGWEKAGAALCL